MSYRPKLLRVDLSKGICQEEDIPEKTVEDFLGGRGFGIKYLYDELQPQTDPLSPDNKLIFSTGPLIGIGPLGMSRWIVTFKSPLTETCFRSSGGAKFGAWLSFAGWNTIIVEGRASKPVYLYLENNQCEIVDGSNLWGLSTIETQKALKETHGPRVTSACIGPGGERFIRYASILTENRCAGRGGGGTVMASKNLKAITINPSGGAKKSSQELKAIIAEGVAAFRAHPYLMPIFSESGTSGSGYRNSAKGILPTRNFREGSVDGFDKLAVSEYAKFKEGDTGCYGCMVQCGNVFRIKNGPHAGVRGEPDYQTIASFTGSINSNDIATTIVADSLCDEMGIDTISAGNCIGFAYELFERRILSKEDTAGLDLTYGNREAALELLRRIANREGLGDILAEGIKRAAEHIGNGAANYAMHIKGLEMPAYDPRGAKWNGLGYITSPCGANHNLSYSWQELLDTPYPRLVDRFAEEGYAPAVKFNQDLTAAFDSIILCTFVGNMQEPPLTTLCQMLAVSTGIPLFASPANLFLVGERIWNLEHAFNIREGFNRKDDTYPKRFTTEPLKKAGPSEGAVIENPEGMLDQYYAVRGWNHDGIPTPEKLVSLGLDGVVTDAKK